MDVLYRVRRGRDNEPLRYSLRSLSNVPHGEVFIVGAPPSWTRNVTVLPPDKWQSKWRGLLADTWSACKRLAGRTLLLMDDDYFILSPRESVEPLHRGLLADDAKTRMGAYRRSLTATGKYLTERGITSLSYELHVPMVIEADGMAEALEPVVDSRYPLQCRSLYGNLAAVGGEQAQDVKRFRDEPLPADYLSVAPSSWHLYRDRLASLFPMRSVYE